MSGRNEERSERIIAAALRLIDITAQIDDVLDQASSLVEDRKAAMHELADLTNVSIGAYPLGSLDVARAVADAVLIVLFLHGGSGASEEEISIEVAGRIGSPVPGDEIGKTLSHLVKAKEIARRDDRWFVAKFARPLRSGLDQRSTVKAMIRDVLAHTPGPLGVADIREAIGKRFEREVDRTTISPILARMRKAGEVKHVDRRWSLIDAELVRNKD